jgi:hypothetical protein
VTAVFDCFLFNDELDVLEHRLEVLDEVVTTFVVVEAAATFQGRPKPLHFANNRNRYGVWIEKIRHVVVELSETDNPWDREREQHRALAASLLDARADDLIIVGDCDEVPFVHVVRRLLTSQAPPTRLYAQNGVYWANTVKPQLWTDGTMAFRWRDRDHPALGMLLGVPGAVWGSFDDPASVQHGGWHFGDLGDSARIIRKLNSFSHTELLTPRYSEYRHVERCRTLGIDYRGNEMLRLLSTDELPCEVLKVRDVDADAVRTDAFPPRYLREVYVAFSRSRRWLPSWLILQADRHIYSFLAVFGIPLLFMYRVIHPLSRALRRPRQGHAT